MLRTCVFAVPGACPLNMTPPEGNLDVESTKIQNGMYTVLCCTKVLYLTV